MTRYAADTREPGLSPTARRLKVAALALVLIPFNVLMGAVPAAIGVAIPLAIVKLIVRGTPTSSRHRGFTSSSALLP